MQYITTENAKTSKSAGLGYLTGILYLAPAKQAGGKNICPHASAGCLASCLYTAGRGRFNNVQRARINKTRALFSNPRAFIEALALDIQALERKAKRLGLAPVIRLNGTSDLPWENMGGQLGVSLMDRFPHVQFYDYTKNPSRAINHARGSMPPNYFLAFSRSECNARAVADVIEAGGSVAAVFSTAKGRALPKSWAGRPVVDGDLHDAIFHHGSGVIIGLRAKGDAKRDTSGFVIMESEVSR